MVVMYKLVVLSIIAPLAICNYTKGQNYRGAIVTNGYECAEIGKSMLREGGSAVDAAVAALLCDGIAMPQTMGLGGGFLMTIYIRETKTVHILNARDSAPINAHRDMYNGNSTLSFQGGLSVAVPGELKGYWEAHKKYGKLPWKKLFEPSINLCRTGHLVTKYLDGEFKRNQDLLFKSPTLREIYIDPKTNQTYKEGHYLKRPKLEKTLELIANEGPDVLYNGKLTKQFVQDIKEFNGIITEEDLRLYKPKWQRPLQTTIFNNLTMYTTPLPGSGVILSFMLHVLDGFLAGKNFDTAHNWQKTIETFKYGYAKQTRLGDPDFNPLMNQVVDKLMSSNYSTNVRNNINVYKTYQDAQHYEVNNVTYVEDHGTAHISILVPNGDAVSVTSSINYKFGAGIRSTSTGIILNNGMNDFSAPNIVNVYGVSPSSENYIAPYKQPISSMCPTIFTDKYGSVKFVIGAAGGTRITTSVALVTLRKLLFGEKLKTAFKALRLHHQLYPMAIMPDLNFDKKILDYLHSTCGHRIYPGEDLNGFNAVMAIAVNGKNIEAHFDPRRGGGVKMIE